jgi:WD40 repeat protein
MEQRLYDLLHQCTVRLAIPKSSYGTGFFVAPGLILTCAHVVKTAQLEGSPVEVLWGGQQYFAQVVSYFPDPPDLALLEVPLTDHPCVMLQAEVFPLDPLYSYGYTDDHPNGDPATFVMEGNAGEHGEQLKFKMGQVRPGLSGAPLLNIRTSRVCGIVRLTRDRGSDMGGRAIPVTIVFQVFPQLVVKQLRFHFQDSRWTNCLSAELDRPKDYIPLPRNPLFQPRPGEFERLETELLLKRARSSVVGLVGLGGVGKTQLTIEFAYHSQHHFPDGIFWMLATGNSAFEWQPRLAELAKQTEYLPPDDNPSHADYEMRRAIHFCRYLTTHKNALLILDNVENTDLVFSALPKVAGTEIACSTLYTTRNQVKPPGGTTLPVEQLSEEQALRLLLETTRPDLLMEIGAGLLNTETSAARFICQRVGCLPLALIHLRGLLARDKQVTLTRLAEVLTQRGALELAKAPRDGAAPLFATFWLSWEKVESDGARKLFKLASYFPVAAPIPLWLIGIAAGLGEGQDIFEPLGEACYQLWEWSLLEKLSDGQVRLHPLIREFGQRLIAEEGTDKELILRSEAADYLTREFTDLDRLEQRVKELGYWECLEQVRKAQGYMVLLGASQVEQIKHIERGLDRESQLLADQRWWPEVLPGLFYQQFFNYGVEEGFPILAGRIPKRWLRQLESVGTRDRSLLRVFSGHTGFVASVAFSPDGSLILTGSRDETARLWKAESGQLLGILPDHDGTVWDVAFSPKGDLIATRSSSGTVRLWKTDNRQLLSTFSADYMTFSPKGNFILTGSENGKIQLWRVSNGQLEFLDALQCHIEGSLAAAFSPDESQIRAGLGTEGILTAVFSPDESLILAGLANGTVQLWQRSNGELLSTLRVGSSQKMSILGIDIPVSDLSTLAFSRDEKLVLTVTSTSRTIELWQLSDGQLLGTLQGPTERINCAVFSPDSSLVLAGSEDHTARLWQVSDYQPLAVFSGHTSAIQSVAFSPNGNQVLTGGEDQQARLWQIDNTPLSSNQESQTDQIACVIFSPDGSVALTGSDNGTTRLWQTENGNLLATWEGHTQSVNSLAFSPDGSLALTGSADGTAKLWQVSSGQLLATLEHTSEDDVGHISEGEIEGELLTALKEHFSEGEIHTALESFNVSEVLSGLSGLSSRVLSVVFSPDGYYIRTGTGHPLLAVGRAWLWRTKDGQLLGTSQGSFEDGVWSLAISPNHGQLFIGSGDHTARLYESSSGKRLASLEGHTKSVDCVAFSPDSSLVLTGSWDKTARLWETSSGKQLAVLEGHTGSVSNVAFSRDGRLAITCDTRGGVFFWQASGTDIGHFLGLYVAAYKVGAVHWLDTQNIILADVGPPGGHPQFYRLKLEGNW